jgi:hypothetical protein
LKQVQHYGNAGYRYAVDMDLEKFFDTVNQSKLIEVLSGTVKDGRVISLIHKYLNAGVMTSHKFGWVNYFKLADMEKLLIRTDEWFRRRLRMVIWKQWKRIKTKFRNLMKLGTKKSKAWEHANTRKGYWHTANSFILSCTVTNERLKRSGYLFFTDYYCKVRVVN